MDEDESLDDEETEETGVVDTVAREELRELRQRFEGGKLIPSFGLIVRRTFNSITSWTGWEVLGIGCGFSTILLLLVVGVVFIGRSCTSHEQALIEQRVEHTREQYQPICETLGLQFVSVQNVQVINNSGEDTCQGELCPGIVEHIVCAGADRVVTINARDINQSTVHLLE